MFSIVVFGLQTASTLRPFNLFTWPEVLLPTGPFYYPPTLWSFNKNIAPGLIPFHL